MRKRYEIKINPPTPSRESIDQYRDFDGLLATYKETEAPRRPARIRQLIYAAGLAAAAAAVGWLLIIGLPAQSPSYQKRQTAYFESKPFILPPGEDLPKVAFTSFPIESTQGGLYEHPNGTRLHFEAQSFQDENGEPVSGAVDIHYREMHDYVDFFLSGIPMVYDSAGTSYTLVSAGMMEIYAEKDGKRVHMRPGKSIDVEMVSEIKVPNINVPPNYNIYKLDTVGRQWVYQDIDRIQVVNASLESLDENHPFYEEVESYKENLSELDLQRQYEMDLAASQLPMPAEPLPPLRQNSTDFVFDFSFNLDTDGAQHPYEGSLWQLKPGSSIDKAALNRPWDDMEIRQLNTRDYELTLIKDTEQLVVVVNPVLSGAEYEQARKNYQQEYETYQQLLTERRAQLQLLRDSLNQVFADQRQRIESIFQRRLKRWQEASETEADLIARQKIINRFTAHSFGIWNCDRPIPPEEVVVQGSLQMPNGEVLEQRTAYLVDKNRNTVKRLLIDDPMEFRFNANSQNMLWMVTEENKIAVVRPQKFQNVKPGNRNATFVLDVIDRELKREQDVREILYF